MEYQKTIGVFFVGNERKGVKNMYYERAPLICLYRLSNFLAGPPTS